jgi:cell division septation protein DedD
VSPSPGGAALKDEPGPSPLPSPTSFWVIVGSFTERGKSDDMAARLKQKGYAASVLDNGAGRFEIRVGPFASLAEAEPVMDRLRVEGLRPFVVGNPESK